MGRAVGSQTLGLGNIIIDGGVTAKAPGILNGQVSPAVFVFERTAEGWKFSLLDVIVRVDQLRAESRKHALIDEDEAILKMLEARTGRPIRKDIWKPMRGAPAP